MPLRRIRGLILRLVRRRLPAIGVGLALGVLAAWLGYRRPIDAWWVDGSSLILGATAAALVWTGLTGAAPDWIDEAQSSRSDFKGPGS